MGFGVRWGWLDLRTTASSPIPSFQVGKLRSREEGGFPLFIGPVGGRIESLLLLWEALSPFEVGATGGRRPMKELGQESGGKKRDWLWDRG